MTGWHRITKAAWASLGGLRNSNLCRNMRSGRWLYYKRNGS
jgi:hypothetical protein